MLAIGYRLFTFCACFGQGMMTHIALDGNQVVGLQPSEAGRCHSVSPRASSEARRRTPAALLCRCRYQQAGVGWQMAWTAGVGSPITDCTTVCRFSVRAYPESPKGQAVETVRKPMCADWTRAKKWLGDPIFWVLLIGVLAALLLSAQRFIFHQDYMVRDCADWPSDALRAQALQLVAMHHGGDLCPYLSALLSIGLEQRRILPFFLVPLSLSGCFTMALDRCQGIFGALSCSMVLLGVSLTGFLSTLFGSFVARDLRHRKASRGGSIRLSMPISWSLRQRAGPGITGSID